MNTYLEFGNYIFSPASGFPIPKLTTSISKNRTSSQQYLGSKQTIELNGVIVGSGVNDLLQKAISLQTGVVSSNPERFIFGLKEGITTNPVISGTGYVTKLQFDTNKNHATNLIEYQISIDFDATTTGSPINNIANVYRVESVDDNVSISVSSENYMIGYTTYPLYDITRTTSAKGSRYFASSGAIVEALRWINDRKALFPLTGILPTGKFPLFNHTRTLDVNELEGNISITDKFISKPILPNDPWTHKYTVSTQIREDFTEELSIKGNIIGLAPATGINILETPLSPSVHKSGISIISPFGVPNIINSGTKYNSAMSGYKGITGLFTGIISQHYNLVSSLNTDYSFPYPSWSKPPLNLTPINFVETFNPHNGEITYNFTFDNRPNSYISGAISETLTVNENSPVPRHTTIPVLGRRLGPVVYFYTASSGLGNRSVSYEGVFAPPSGFSNIRVDMQILRAIDNLVNSLGPSLPYSGYVTADDQKINIGENRITRNKTWSYTKN
jgi:hypothetical protein